MVEDKNNSLLLTTSQVVSLREQLQQAGIKADSNETVLSIDFTKDPLKVLARFIEVTSAVVSNEEFRQAVCAGLNSAAAPLKQSQPCDFDRQAPIYKEGDGHGNA